MNKDESFSTVGYEEQVHLAEHELSSFIAVVISSYGLEQARMSREDWLEEAELIDSPPRSEPRDWHAVTVAASARLAQRVNFEARLADMQARAAREVFGSLIGFF